MDAESLREETEIEFDRMAAVLDEVEQILRLAAERPLSPIEKTAAGAFLSQLYGGLENILKRLCRHVGVNVPEGSMWHAELFRKFCPPAGAGLPVLFDESLQENIEDYRRFRHLFVHGYGIELDWAKMEEGVARAPDVFHGAMRAVRDYLQTLG